MSPPAARWLNRRWRFLPAAAGVVAYGYWATAQPAFGTSAYVAVGAPVAVAVVAGVLGRSGWSIRARRPVPATLGAAWPWLVIGGLMAGLEAAGLALGGRSRAVPTLSTVVDHALVWHLSRLLLFAGWLLIGWGLVSLAHPARRR